MAKARPYSDSRNACSGGGLNAGARIFEREGQVGRSAHRAQAFQIWHWMRLAVRKLIADYEGFEPMHNPKSGKQHFGIWTRRVRNRYHRDTAAIREGKKRL